jgi:hypothetical protein
VSENYGVKETTDVIMFVGAAVQFLNSAYQDKKIDAKDFFAALPALAQLEGALEKFDMVAKELDELNESEKNYIAVLVDGQLGSGVFLAVGSDLLIAGRALGRVFEKINTFKKGKAK